MSTTSASLQTRPTALAPTVFAAAGAVAAIALTAYGTFKEDNIAGDTRDWLLINLPIIVVGTAIVFGIVVRRALRHDSPEPIERTSLVLALLSVATYVVSYLGLNTVLAAGAVCTAVAATRRAGRWTTLSGVSVALSAVAVALAVSFAILG